MNNSSTPQETSEQRFKEWRDKANFWDIEAGTYSAWKFQEEYYRPLLKALEERNNRLEEALDKILGPSIYSSHGAILEDVRGIAHAALSSSKEEKAKTDDGNLQPLPPPNNSITTN